MDANAVGSDAGAKAFTYDANGNLTYDGRKDLDIQWNIFNLTSGAVTHDGSLTYARLSDGTLVWSQNTSGSITTGKRYCGSFVFTTGTGITTPQVESIAWDEGRIFRDAQTGTYRDCWFAGDHLGDVRSVLDISPNLSSPVVLEQNDYLPFGTKIANSLHAQMNANRWRSAGKEEFPEVEMLDFGARLYDPFTARWTANDPSVNKYTSFSPYSYCANNPVNVVDPDGQKIIFVHGFASERFGFLSFLKYPGERYWGKTIEYAQKYLHDNNIDVRSYEYSLRSTAEERRRDGYEFAKENYTSLVSDLQEGESIRFVSHSMGAAYAEGIANFLRDQGQEVDIMLHFAPYQASDISASVDSGVLTLDIQTNRDPVLATSSSNGMIQNAIHLYGFSSAPISQRHTESLLNEDYWKMIKKYVDSFLKGRSIIDSDRNE